MGSIAVRLAGTLIEVVLIPTCRGGPGWDLATLEDDARQHFVDIFVENGTTYGPLYGHIVENPIDEGGRGGRGRHPDRSLKGTKSVPTGGKVSA